jgi:hypothetical protein
MAIYHLHISSGSRSGGQSASAKLDYISRKGKYENRPDNVLSTDSHLPEWATSPNDFWSAVDEHERANAKLFMEVEFALPRELSLKQQEAVVKEFIQTNIPKQPHTWAIHAGKGTNPHCHLVFNERTLDGVKRNRETFFKRANKKHPEKGGAAKKRYLKSTDFLRSIRKSWETHANDALKSANKKVEIDCRTLKAQGIDRIPGVHRGPNRQGRIETEIRKDKHEINKENSSIDPEWSHQIIQRIAREIAESEARGRRNRLEIDRAVKFFDAQNRERVRVPAEDVPGVRELHQGCAESFVYAQDRGRADQLRRESERADEINRKSYELNRGEIQRDRERGRRLRQRKSYDYIRGVIKFVQRNTQDIRIALKSVGEKFNTLSWRLIRKKQAITSGRVSQERVKNNEREWKIGF